MMKMYQGKKFDREQLVFVSEAVLCSALDRIESGMPTSGIDWEERLHYANGIDQDARTLTSWDRGVLETAGMALAVFYAQLTNDGLGIGDALACAGDFGAAVAQWVEMTWTDNGEAVQKRMKELRSGQHWPISKAYVNYPDCKKHAKEFVDRVFEEYINVPGS